MRSENGLFKIGHTGNVQARLVSMQTLPVIVELLHYVGSSDAPAVERILHLCFASKRVRGEWFRLEEEDVTRFKSFSFLTSKTARKEFPSVRMRPTTLKQRLVQLRVARGLSVNALARLAGLVGTHLFMIENGMIANPRPNTVQRLARALGVSPKSILGKLPQCG